MDGAASNADPGKRAQLAAVATRMAGRPTYADSECEGKLGGPLYTLRADYWPRSRDRPAHASLTGHAEGCDTGRGSARYELNPMPEGDGSDAGPYLPEETRAALLTRFAERSAQAHGRERVRLRHR